jgi:hypothetical protein
MPWLQGNHSNKRLPVDCNKVTIEPCIPEYEEQYIESGRIFPKPTEADSMRVWKAVSLWSEES